MWESFIDTPEAAVIGIVAVGVLTGLLLRSWWSVVYAPGSILILLLIAALMGELLRSNGESENTRPAEVSPWLLWTVLVFLPLGLGAALGTVIGKALDEHEPRSPAPF
jgi:hypothetical protein